MRVITRNVMGINYLLPVGEDNLKVRPMELNDTAFEIYQLLSNGFSIGEVSGILAQKYGISRDEIHADVTSCYNSFHSKGIL